MNALYIYKATILTASFHNLQSDLSFFNKRMDFFIWEWFRANRVFPHQANLLSLEYAVSDAFLQSSFLQSAELALLCMYRKFLLIVYFVVWNMRCFVYIQRLHVCRNNLIDELISYVAEAMWPNYLEHFEPRDLTRVSYIYVYIQSLFFESAQNAMFCIYTK